MNLTFLIRTGTFILFILMTAGCSNRKSSVLGLRKFFYSGAAETVELRSDWTYRQIITDKTNVTYVNIGDWWDYGDHIELKGWVDGRQVIIHKSVPVIKKGNLVTQKSLFKPQSSKLLFSF